MYAIKAIYDGLNFKPVQPIPITEEYEVIITFIEPIKANTIKPSYGDSILEIINNKNIPHKTININAKGHIIVDKDKDAELYDWAVNG
jgi:predicted DNA-binding antitoxin AbrB/MazE fold protein